MIRLLIAEDSDTIRRVLTTLLENERHIEIVGIAKDGEEAVEKCRELRPDLVTMDIFMPRKNGLEATRQIMAECPTRIVIISSMVGARDTHFAFEAMRAGAIEVIEKPTGLLQGRYAEVKKSLIHLIETSIEARPAAQMSWLPSAPSPAPYDLDEKRDSTAPSLDISTLRPKLLAIGGSTGAPTVIVEILSRLPKTFPMPVIVAQHITKGFAPKMAHWLNSTMELNVEIATAESQLIPGNVLVCPDDQLLSFTGQGRYRLFERGAHTGHIPSVDHLFSSVAAAYADRAVGVILSGMGKDGADGLYHMRQQGALTIAQNEQTSVVFGMNHVACERGAVQLQQSPHKIADTLLTISKNF